MKDISIAVIDTNKLNTIKLKLFLIQEEFVNVDTFNSLDEFFQSNKDYDIIIITEDLFKNSFLEVYKDSIFLIIGESIKDVDNFQVFYIQKHFSDNELKQEIATITLLKQYEKEMEKKNQALKEALEYINQQEDMAATKQLNMIYDNVSFHKIGDLLIDNFYSPKDKLSGDSYIALHTDESIFLIIIDAMGKGISASLTSTLVSGIGNYILDKTFNLEEILQSYIKYVKTILLDSEALCMVLFKIDKKTNNIKIVNFGMPPIYMLKDNEVIKLKPNNKPILKNIDYSINIQTVESIEYDKIMLFSDGLVESPLKDSEMPYLIRFKNVFKKFYFLRDIVKDFKHHAIKDDDTTIFSIVKPPKVDTLIFKKEINFFTKSDLDNLILEIDGIIKEKETIKQKMFLVFQEIFLNIFEHAYREDYDKQEIVKLDKIFSPVKGWLKVEIYKNYDFYHIIIEDNGKGFDVSKILRLENKVNFKRFHRRGLLLILNVVSGLYFENEGKKVHVYIRRYNGT